jgi:hypothetical protein
MYTIQGVLDMGRFRGPFRVNSPTASLRQSRQEHTSEIHDQESGDSGTTYLGNRRV